MPSLSGSPLSLSSAHIYNLPRDPNIPPPTRSNHLPISSQTSPGDPSSSSPSRNLTSSHEVEMHVDDALGDDEDEFAGLEMMGLTQWQREVPSSNKTERPNDTVRDEYVMKGHEEEEIDELDESDLELPPEMIFHTDLFEEDARVAMHSPIAGPSSPPLQTPAFSLPSLNSDIPSGPYPQTPQTADPDRQVHQDHNHDHDSPILWSRPQSPSPLFPRDRVDKQGKRSLIILSDDSDMEEVDKENHVITFPREGSMINRSRSSRSSPVIEQKEGNSAPLSLALVDEDDDDSEEPLATRQRKRSRLNRVIDSEEEDEEPLSLVKKRRNQVGSDADDEEEPLGVQQRRREMGKQRESNQVEGEAQITLNYDFTEDILATMQEDAAAKKETLDDLFDEDDGKIEGYDPRAEDQVNLSAGQEAGEEEDIFDFGDFPFGEIDLELANRNIADSINAKTQEFIKPTTRSRTKSKSKSKSPQKQKQKKTPFIDLSNDLLPADENPGRPSNSGRSILGIMDKAGPIGVVSRWPENPEWEFPMISDLDERWQDFYKNHWRRGVDKMKTKTSGAGVIRNQRDMRIGGIVSEDEDESEGEGWAPPKASITIAKKTAQPAKRGPWGAWRGRGRGAWRGRGAARSARGKSRKK
ncbi:uncharacterized protein I303_101768 [Kwoniella dejecticola CBS 10117]|uniref:Uncharacterized protein n=1 Tax=Kwoniella dejecticola CBS 10117 TaxID=1296121 RepID=A0AAJ8KK66_9TREE